MDARNPRPASERLNSGTRRNIFAFAHSVLLCVFEALNVFLSASLIPGLRSLSLAYSGVIDDAAPSGLEVGRYNSFVAIV